MMMNTATDIINAIIDALDEFGLADIDNETTTVLVNKNDHGDVCVINTEFNTFTESHATMASFLVAWDGDYNIIQRSEIRKWVSEFVD